MKKVWICGASGMLGSHIKQLLSERNIVYTASNRKEIDITNLDQVSHFVKEQKISHIINCAAYTQVDRAEVEQQQAYLINAIGPQHLGLVGKRHKVRVLHFSTDYVFDGKACTPYEEKDYCMPLGAYGMSKFAGEIKLLDEHPQACILRTSWLFGYPGKNFVETMLRLMNEREDLSVVFDQIGRPTYCKDLAIAALEILDEKGVFHFANSSETSWYQFAKEIHQQAIDLGFPLKMKNLKPILTKDYPQLAQRPLYSPLSTKKIEGYLGYPPRTWQDALFEYLTILRNHQTSTNSFNYA